MLEIEHINEIANLPAILTTQLTELRGFFDYTGKSQIR